MESLEKSDLIALLKEALAAKTIAEQALATASEALIEVRAMQKSTHKTVLVDPYQQQQNVDATQKWEETMEDGLHSVDELEEGDPMGEYS